MAKLTKKLPFYTHFVNEGNFRNIEDSKEKKKYIRKNDAIRYSPLLVSILAAFVGFNFNDYFCIAIFVGIIFLEIATFIIVLNLYLQDRNNHVFKSKVSFWFIYLSNFLIAVLGCVLARFNTKFIELESGDIERDTNILYLVIVVLPVWIIYSIFTNCAFRMCFARYCKKCEMDASKIDTTPLNTSKPPFYIHFVNEDNFVAIENLNERKSYSLNSLLSLGFTFIPCVFATFSGYDFQNMFTLCIFGIMLLFEYCGINTLITLYFQEREYNIFKNRILFWLLHLIPFALGLLGCILAYFNTSFTVLENGGFDVQINAVYFVCFIFPLYLAFCIFKQYAFGKCFAKHLSKKDPKTPPHQG